MQSDETLIRLAELVARGLSFDDLPSGITHERDLYPFCEKIAIRALSAQAGLDEPAAAACVATSSYEGRTPSATAAWNGSREARRVRAFGTDFGLDVHIDLVGLSNGVPGQGQVRCIGIEAKVVRPTKAISSVIAEAIGQAIIGSLKNAAVIVFIVLLKPQIPDKIDAGIEAAVVDSLWQRFRVRLVIRSIPHA